MEPPGKAQPSLCLQMDLPQLQFLCMVRKLGGNLGNQAKSTQIPLWERQKSCTKICLLQMGERRARPVQYPCGQGRRRRSCFWVGMWCVWKVMLTLE